MMPHIQRLVYGKIRIMHPDLHIQAWDDKISGLFLISDCRFIAEFFYAVSFQPFLRRFQHGRKLLLLQFFFYGFSRRYTPKRFHLSSPHKIEIPKDLHVSTDMLT